MAENLDELYERSLYLINQLSAEVQADIKESREFRQEMREDREESRKDREESRRRMDRIEAAVRDFSKDSKRISKNLSKSMEQTNKRLESFGIVQGQVAEDLFYRNLPVLLKAYHIAWNDLQRNIIGEKAREYDLAAINSSTAFVFEVKNKLRLDDINRFHDVQLPDFKPNFPAYANHTVYGGIGALVVRKDLQKYAEKLGLFVLTQGENENACLHTPQKPLEF